MRSHRIDDVVVRSFLKIGFFIYCSSFAVFGISGADSATQTNGTTNQLEALKTFLSHPPAIERIVFEKEVVSYQADRQQPWQTNYTLFRGGCEGRSFFVEEFSSAAQITSPRRISGREKNLHWVLQNGELLKWEKNSSDTRNVVETTVGGVELELWTALNVGMRMLDNQTLTWIGNRFDAEGDNSLFRGKTPNDRSRITLKGEFTVTPEGMISGLKFELEGIERPLIYQYEYREATKVPWFFPRVIKQEFYDSAGAVNGLIERRILELVVSGERLVFSPDRITNSTQNIRAALVYTNNILFKEQTNGLSPVQVRPQNETSQSTSQSTSRSRVPVLIVFAAVGLGLPAIFYFGSCKFTKHENK